MRDRNLARKVSHFLIVVLVLQSFLVGFSVQPATGQEPIIQDIGGGRRTASWTLDNEAHYTSQNVAFEGGGANLALNNYTWHESQQSDFLDGTWNSTVMVTPNGNLSLVADNTNLVSNGDFSSDMDWVFANGSGNNIISERDGFFEKAHLHYYGGAGPFSVFDNMDDSTGNWTRVGTAMTVPPINNASDCCGGGGSLQVGWIPSAPDEWGGIRQIAGSPWDWSNYNRLSIWFATNYTGSSLEVYLNITDTDSVRWDTPKEEVAGDWNQSVFDLGLFPGDLSQITRIDIRFLGLGGTIQYNVSVDLFELYWVKIYNETASVNQTFTKTNVTDSTPGNVILDCDVVIEERLNLVNSSLYLIVSNSSNQYVWEKYDVIPPISNHISVDLSWLMAESGLYNISMQLFLSVNTTNESSYSVKFDNIIIVAPNRKNGTYLSDPHDTLSQSIWREISWVDGPFDPETSVNVSTRTGNSSNTSDASWSGWESPSSGNITSPANRYIQYKVDLNTTNASRGPDVSEMNTNYEQYVSLGIVETDNLTVPDLYLWEDFFVKDLVSPETEIAYYYSSDMGGNWSSILNGTSLFFVTNDTLKFRAELRTFNTTRTPYLYEMNLTYQYLGILDHIHMSDSSLSVSAGTVVYLSAWGHDAFHRNVSFQQKWETNDPLKLIDPFGNYTAGAVGSWRVYCNNTNDSISNWTIIDVSVGALVRIGVDPWNPGTLTTDDQLQFNATGYDSMSNSIGPVDVTWSVLGSIGVIPPGPSASSMFVATTVGQGRVHAEYGIHTNQTELFNVVAGQLDSIVVAPNPKDILPGISWNFTAQGYDADINEITLTSTIWETNVGIINSFDATNVNFTAQSTEYLGGYIRATEGSVSGEAVINVDNNDDPPWLAGVIPNQIKPEDFGAWILNLTDYARDAEDPLSLLRWHIDGVNTSLYSVTGDDKPGNHLLTFTTVRDAFGDDEITLSLLDRFDQSVQQSLWVNITPVNDRPKISAPEKVYVRYDVPYPEDYTPFIEDVDNPIQDITLTTDDPIHATVQGLEVTYNYPQSMVDKPIFVVLTVSDGIDQHIDVVQVFVSGNYPPRLITNIPDITMNEDQQLVDGFDLDDYFEDPDDDVLSFDSISNKVGIDIDSGGLVTLTPEHDWFGDELVIFTATDSAGAEAQDAVLVHVLPVNDAPVIAGLPDIVIRYNETFDFDVTPYVSDVDNPLTELTISCSDAGNTSVSKLTVFFTYQSPMELDVTITVRDKDNAEASDTMGVRVTDNRPPVSRGPPDVILNEDTPLLLAFDLDQYFYDPDGGNLTYTFYQALYYVDVDLNGTNWMNFTPVSDWSGQEVIVVRAMDEEEAIVEDMIVVTVLPVNDAPVFTPIPRQSGEINKPWLLDLSQYVYDVDNSTEDLMFLIDSEYVTVVGHYGIFLCNESFSIDVADATVSDGLLQDSQPIEISISSLVSPEVNIFIWPASIGIVLLALFGLTYWRATRRYAMEDLFIVGKEGKLIVHKTKRARPDRDEDILAGMLTAVQEFAKDVFREEREELKAFELQQKKIVIETANNFYAAAIFAGKEPRWASKSLEAFVEDVDTKYGTMIETWSGDMGELEDLPDMADYFVRARKYEVGDWGED
ncbi:MAG: hypothetical protein JSV43_00100 [Methanobacteriota archaeon]|nr:MAG: hypothetical protein JSV43_00100 [Euryarchaeota archaeon]